MTWFRSAIVQACQLLRAQRQTALTAAICLGAFCFFGGLASEVLEGETQKLDRHILLMMRNPNDTSAPAGGPWMEEVMRDISALGGVFWIPFVTIAVVVYLLIQNRMARSAYVGGAVVTGAILSLLLKREFQRPRPDLLPHGSVAYMSSFPSGHSLVSAVVYLTLGALLASSQNQLASKIYIVALSVVTVLLVGISRVYLGVHWPSDVVAGWLAGTGWATLSWLVWTKLFQGRTDQAGTGK
jgi:undecaprenyl-diphosphatase